MGGGAGNAGEAHDHCPERPSQYHPTQSSFRRAGSLPRTFPCPHDRVFALATLGHEVLGGDELSHWNCRGAGGHAGPEAAVRLRTTAGLPVRNAASVPRRACLHIVKDKWGHRKLGSRG